MAFTISTRDLNCIHVHEVLFIMVYGQLSINFKIIYPLKLNKILFYRKKIEFFMYSYSQSIQKYYY